MQEPADGLRKNLRTRIVKDFPMVAGQRDGVDGALQKIAPAEVRRKESAVRLFSAAEEKRGEVATARMVAATGGVDDLICESQLLFYPDVHGDSRGVKETGELAGAGCADEACLSAQEVETLRDGGSSKHPEMP